MLSGRCLQVVKQRLPCVRYYRARKPMWLGTAKTKLLRVSEAPVLPKEEKVEIFKLYTNYRTQIKSIKQFCREEYYLKDEKLMTRTSTESEANSEEVIELLKENQRENERVAKIREADMAKIVDRQTETLEDQYLNYLEETIKQQEISEKKIEELKLDAKNYITTPEQLDEAIEKALSNAPLDRTYFITKDGPVIEEEPKLETN